MASYELIVTTKIDWKVKQKLFSSYQELSRGGIPGATYVLPFYSITSESQKEKGNKETSKD